MVNMESEHLLAQLEYGWLSLNRDDFEAAAAAAKEVLSHETEHPDALFLLGLAALNLKDAASAEVATKKLLEVEPEDARSHLLLGFYSHEMLKDPVAAERAFRECVKQAPEEPEYYAFLGQFLATRDRYQEGIATARKGLRIDPDHLLVVQALAALYRLAENKDMAEKFGRRALELAPEESGNFLEAGFRLLDSGEKMEATGNFREALRLSPDAGDSFESIAHEKVRNHPLFKKGIYLPTNKITIFGAVITPVFWWLLSLLWQPMIWMALLSLVVVVGLYLYTGLFHFCRWRVLCGLRNGRL